MPIRYPSLDPLSDADRKVLTDYTHGISRGLDERIGPDGGDPGEMIMVLLLVAANISVAANQTDQSGCDFVTQASKCWIQLHDENARMKQSLWDSVVKNLRDKLR